LKRPAEARRLSHDRHAQRPRGTGCAGAIEVAATAFDGSAEIASEGQSAAAS